MQDNMGYGYLAPRISGLEHSCYSDSLCAGRSGDEIPVRVRFFVPGSYSALCTMGAGFVSRGLGVDHLPPSIADVKERVYLYLCSRSGPSWPVLV